MLVIGLILTMFGIGLFCWLIFTLAVYALPFVVGLSAGMAAFHSGAGVPGALLVGVVTGALTLGIGQVAFAFVRPIALRAVIATAFAVPAAIAGYHTVLGLSQIGVPSLLWRDVFCLGRRDHDWLHGVGAHDGSRGLPPAEARACAVGRFTTSSHGRNL
jgi:hypothetical protein